MCGTVSTSFYSPQCKAWYSRCVVCSSVWCLLRWKAEVKRWWHWGDDVCSVSFWYPLQMPSPISTQTAIPLSVLIAHLKDCGSVGGSLLVNTDTDDLWCTEFGLSHKCSFDVCPHDEISYWVGCPKVIEQLMPWLENHLLYSTVQRSFCLDSFISLMYPA